MKLFSRSLQYSSLKNRTNTRLPDQHHLAHDLCFVLHDVMTQLLVSGHKASAFTVTVKFRDDTDRKAFEEQDIFDWLAATRRADERVAILVTIVFPAILWDMLHCFYEALETSRKGKLGVSFTLIRKPLQESLFVLESIVADRKDFADKLSLAPSSSGARRQVVLKCIPNGYNKCLMCWESHNALTPATLLVYGMTRKRAMVLMVSAIKPFTCSQATRQFRLNLSI
jgi:hypothetical protein